MEPQRLYPYEPFEQISSKHYRYTPEAVGYRLDLSRVWQDKHAIHGRIKLYQASGPEAWACKHFEDANLSTKTFYRSFVETAKEINPSMPWLMWLQAFLLHTTEAIDRPAPLQRVQDIALSRPPADYIPDLVLDGVPNLVWAQGGTGKSWLGAWVALCIASGAPWLSHATRQGNVLYYDWEAGPDAFRRRVEKVARGLGIAVPANLHYRYCTRPLSAMEETFASDIYEHQIQVALLDAMGGAEGERKEFSDSRDGIMGIFALMREHRLTSFLIDHIAGEGLKAPREVMKPYGSIYKLNQARNAWMLTRQPSAEARIIHYALQHKKINEGFLNTTGYDYELDGTTLDVVRFHPAEARSTPSDHEWVTQMDGLLCTRPASVAEIATYTGQKVGTIDQYLRRKARDTGEYEALRDAGKTNLWRLTSGATESEAEPYVPF